MLIDARYHAAGYAFDAAAAMRYGQACYASRPCRCHTRAARATLMR